MSAATPTKNWTGRTTIVSAPLPADLAQRLRERARRNDRHVAGELRRIVRDALGGDENKGDSALVCEGQ